MPDNPDMSTSTALPSPPPLEGTNLMLGTVGVSLAMLMNTLDQSIANVSLPAIAGDLNASTEQSTWVVTAYIVANALSVLLSGWLAQRFGQVRLMVASLLLFSLSSLLCGLAPNLNMLILFRFLQGFVAGPMMVLGQPLILQSYPPAKSGQAIAAYFVTTSVGPIIGPLLGGAITDNLSWSWIFFINIPIGILAFAIVWPIYRHRESERQKLPIDGIGLALVAISVVCLQLTIEQGRDLDWFESPQIIALAVCGGIAFCFFMAWELTERHPVVDLSHFRHVSFLVGTTVVSIAFPLMVVQMVIPPIWVQHYLGYNATWAGFTMIWGGLVSVVFTFIAGRLTPHLDGRIMASIGLAAFLVACYLRTRMTSSADFVTIALPQAFIGLASGFFFVPLFSIALRDIQPGKVASAAGLMAFLRYFGTSVLTSLMVTLWERRSFHHAQHLNEGLNDFNPRYQAWLDGPAGMGGNNTVSTAVLQERILVESATLAANDLFMLSLWCVSAMLFVIWLFTPSASARPLPSRR